MAGRAYLVRRFRLTVGGKGIGPPWLEVQPKLKLKQPLGRDQTTRKARDGPPRTGQTGPKWAHAAA